MSSRHDPAVITWQIALAPRPRPPKVGHHWWRDLVMEFWRAAHDQWNDAAEHASLGYATELAEWRADKPAPHAESVHGRTLTRCDRARTRGLVTTTREVQAAKAERQRRQRRRFGPEDRGPLCPVCRTATVRQLVDVTGTPVHPACSGGGAPRH